MTEPSDTLSTVPDVAVPPLAVGTQPSLATDVIEVGPVTVAEALSFESGLELVARSQWWYARHRFFRHRLAIGSLVVLLLVFIAGALAHTIAPYGRGALDFT